MKFSVLNSSSSGNATYLKIKDKNCLLDAGISPTTFVKKLESINEKFERLDYIFITHEHIDHVSGLVSLINKFKPTVFMTELTYKNLSKSALEKLNPIYIQFVENDDFLKFDKFNVTIFKTSHDAADPVGYIFDEDDKSLVYLTDTGEFNNIDLIKNKTSYIIESNHEESMLEMSNRPWVLINRIESNIGHLSNKESALLFSKLMGENTKSVTLFHLSSECNTKDLALIAYEKVLKGTKIVLNISDKKTPMKMFEI